MKKTYITLSVLLTVLLFSAYLVLQQQGEQSVSADSAQKFALLDSIAVDKIEISSASIAVTLAKDGTNWFIKNPISYKANNTSIADLIHQIKEITIKSIVSSNPEKQSVFHVDSAQGTNVAIYQHGADHLSFIVGKAGPSYSDTYVRKKGSNDVLLVDASLSYQFTKPVKEWRDKTIFSTPQSSINQVAYQFGDTTFTLFNNAGTWMVGNDSTKADVVTSLLSSLSNITADDFLDTVNSATKKIQAQISIGGAQLRFAFDKHSNKYFVQASTFPQWFVVEQWKANQLLKRKKELVRK